MSLLVSMSACILLTTDRTPTSKTRQPAHIGLSAEKHVQLSVSNTERMLASLEISEVFAGVCLYWFDSTISSSLAGTALLYLMQANGCVTGTADQEHRIYTTARDVG